jgi:hypothetical protein
MDFLTAFPYWGMIVIVIINAFLVINRKVHVENNDHNPDH